MVIVDINDELCKIKINKQTDPKTLLDDIAAVEVQYGCMLFKEKKGRSFGTCRHI